MKDLANHSTNLSILLNKERHFLEAITRWNYFPNQKDSASELPPCFSTSRFTPEIAEELSNIVISKERRRCWFDLVEYRATRFNNVPRTLSLIHPLAYSRIFIKIKEHREEIVKHMEDKNSAITAEQHNDGRMFIMNYEDHETKTRNTMNISFSANFRAHADVANCFGSIYTHSLEWATQGYEEAKAKLNDPKSNKHWSSELDIVLRNAKRNETSGIPIGPCSSSIAVEIILAAVDRELAKCFRFVRHIDDYTAFCSSHIEAQNFIRMLNIELSRYRLTLNLNKTKITELPEPIVDSWITKINNALPKRTNPSGALDLTTHEAINFLDFAVHLTKAEPDGSVLKYATSLLYSRAHGNTAAMIFDYILNLCWHFPTLLPALEKINIESNEYNKHEVGEKLNEILKINALHRRSDGMCWSLYYLHQLEIQPTDENIQSIIETSDATAITLLSSFQTGETPATEFAITLSKQNSLYNKIENPYPNDTTFEVLKKYNVQFLHSPKSSSKAEDYCFYLSNPFIDKSSPIGFDAYITGEQPKPSGILSLFKVTPNL